MVSISIALVIVVSYAFQYNRWNSAVANYRQPISRSQMFFQLNAKKKASKLISDDLLASLDIDDKEDTKTEEEPVEKAQKSVKSKDLKKQAKLGISTELLSSLIEDEEPTLESTAESNNKKKKKKKKAGKENSGKENPIELSSDTVVDASDSAGGADAVPGSAHESAVSDPANVIKDIQAEAAAITAARAEQEKALAEAEEELTMEQQIRKEKPSARVRFAESTQPGFVQMGFEDVSLMYGNTVILDGASFSVSTGERVGLVGPNGSGKSSSLKILSGEIEPTTGEIIKSNGDLRVAFLRQEFMESLRMENTLKQELLSTFVEENKIIEEIAKCEDDIAATTDDPERMNAVLERLDKLQDQAASRNAYNLEPKVLKVMYAMGFTEDDGNALVSSFSGGWKMRIGLAKILLLDPNIIFLDEPTNHMDLDSVIWLEGFLSKQSLPMVVVSHDREFLDKVCTKIVDVEDGKMISYQGNYSTFLAQRRERIAQWRDKFEKQNRYVKDEEKWIQKHRSDPNMAQQVKAKEMALEKLKNSDEFVTAPPRDRKFRFRFPPPPRCGERVVEAQDLQHGYGDGKYKVLFKDVSFTVDKGQRVGFVGPNGSGKSTLIRLIYGMEDPQKGYAEFASNSIVANYYAQNQADALDLNLTVLETLQEAAGPDVSLTEIRTLLGQFMFKGDDANKKIRILSGGEKARVAMCKLMLQPANLLLLDEPTNHLDITSKEVLEDALYNYPGAVLIVSHDRYFMSQAVNTIFSFHDKTMERFDCDYHDYMMRMSEGGDADANADDTTKTLKAKIEDRYVKGDTYKITNAKEMNFDEIDDSKKKKKKNFGGSGVTCGNLNKGIKNAKRYANR